MRTLIVGWGNALRGDDAAALIVAARIEAAAWKEVDTLALPQLYPELLDSLAGYKRVIFVDASVSGPAVDLRPLKPARAELASAHGLSPAVLLQLAEDFSLHAPEAYLCTICGVEFGLGQSVSPNVENRIQQAISLIDALIHFDVCCV